MVRKFMKFKEAVREATAPVNGAYFPGKMALENRHRKLVTCKDTRRITGSIDLDRALAKEPKYANEPRWDYGLGYQPAGGREQAIWIEVHSAETSEVSAVIRKFEWLRDWLDENADQLRKLTESADSDIRYIWIASNRLRILPHSRQAKQLSMSGIGGPKPNLKLP